MLENQLKNAVHHVHPDVAPSYIKVLSATPVTRGTVVIVSLTVPGAGPSGCASVKTHVIFFDRAGIASWSKEAV